jgi:hypothetical protein
MSDHLINRGIERKVRVGKYRILFRIDATSAGTILIDAIDAILPRGDIYKHSRQ